MQDFLRDVTDSTLAHAFFTLTICTVLCLLFALIARDREGIRATGSFLAAFAVLWLVTVLVA